MVTSKKGNTSKENTKSQSKFLQKVKKNLVTVIAIGIAIITIILASAIEETSVDTIKPISEIKVFDPLCIGTHSLEFNHTNFCSTQTYMHYLGASANIDESSIQNNHARILFLKINATDVPSSNPFFKTSVSKAELNLKVKYEPALNGEVSPIPFYVTSKYCKDTTWNKSTNDNDLPCIDLEMFPKGEQSTFASLVPKWIDDVKFDLSTHINQAKKNDSKIFTEVIQFYPVQLLNENRFNSTITECINLKSSEDLMYNDLDSCLSFHRIQVYAEDNPSESVRPQIHLTYTTKPTEIATILFAITAASIPIIGGVVKTQFEAMNKKEEDRKKSKKAHAEKMVTICKTLKQEIIAIQNGFQGKDTQGNKSEKFKVVTEFEFSNPKTGKIIFTVTLEKDQGFSFVKSPNHAYQGIVNSGSFEEFESDVQTAVTELYDYVYAYEKYLQTTEEKVHELQIKSNDSNFENIKDAYKSIITQNIKYLAEKRGEILEKIVLLLPKINTQISDFSKDVEAK